LTIHKHILGVAIKAWLFTDAHILSHQEKENHSPFGASMDLELLVEDPTSYST